LIIDHQPANLTVVVNGNASVYEVQNVLKESDQFIPIGPFPGKITIADVIQYNLIGGLSNSLGMVKKWLLNLKIKTDTGEIHTGADVMKNVSGYDLTRMMIGGRGIFGRILQATFKLLPQNYYFNTELPIRDGYRLIMTPSQISTVTAEIETHSIQIYSFPKLGVIDISGTSAEMQSAISRIHSGQGIKMVKIDHWIPQSEVNSLNPIIQQISQNFVKNDD